MNSFKKQSYEIGVQTGKVCFAIEDVLELLSRGHGASFNAGLIIGWNKRCGVDTYAEFMIDERA